MRDVGCPAMSEAVQFPDPVTLAVVALRDEYATYKVDAEVHAEVRDPRPEVWCHVQLVGGSRRDVAVATARIAFVTWHRSDVAAAELAQITRACVGRWSSLLPQVQRVREEAGPVPFPDPDSGAPRYTFTAALDLRHAGVLTA